MDRITKSLLEEFVGEWNLKCLAEDRQFEHFAAYLAASRHHSEAIDPTELVTGSGGDTGIDGLAIIVNGDLVDDVATIEELAEMNGYLDVNFVFVQAERSEAFSTAKIGQFAYGIGDFFSESPRLQRTAAINEAAKLMATIYSLSSKFKHGNPSCHLYYATTGKWTGDPALEARRASTIEDLRGLHIFKEVEFTPIDAERIQKFYRETKNAIVREFTFLDKTVAPELPGVSQAYLGIIPALTLLDLIQDESGELIKSIFYDNVRDWQGYNSVNDGMKVTLSDPGTRSRFVLMNNGITIIAKTLRTTGNRFLIEDYQIVNGCQTSHVLWFERDSLDDSVRVPLRLIATQDENVISSIIRATNRQTTVGEDQLLALSDFQKDLELFFVADPDRSKHLYYERRSRQYASDASIEKTRVISPGNLIRSYAAMFLDEPHRTTRNYRNLFDRVGTAIFGDQHRLRPYYTAAFAYYRLEYLFRNELLEPRYKPARYQLLFALRALLAQGDQPRPNSHAADRYCETILAALLDTVRAEAVFKQAASCVDRVAMSDFDRDTIRTQRFTESLKNDCAQNTIADFAPS